MKRLAIGRSPRTTNVLSPAVSSRARRITLWAAIAAMALGGGWYLIGHTLLGEPIAVSEGTRAPESHFTLLERKGEAELSPQDAMAAERRSFAIVRERPQPMPARMSRLLREVLGVEPVGLRPALAHHMDTSEGVAWLVAGRSVMCIIQDPKGGLVCDTVARAVRHGLFLGLFQPPLRRSGVPRRFAALGLVPDWVEKVEIGAGGKSQTLAVRRGIYALHATTPIVLRRLKGQ
jgi:hypothetical protein